ncbi:ATPase, partial [mine drainage metagenome]
DGPSKMADICTRLGVNANYGSQYRLRLIEVGLVEGSRYGEVDFAQPLLREYLREHAVTLAPSLARTYPPL